jgi:hypothetical protein
MSLENLVAVSGMNGLFKVAGNRSNGLIIEDVDTGKRKFASVRLHQFSPLESISIYTYTDSEPLLNVFKSMATKIESMPASGLQSSNPQILNYFREILPEFDEDRVKINDIKKVIKWFLFLNERGLITEEASGSESEEE